MAAVLTPSGRLALDPVAFIVANQMLTIGMLSPAVLLQDGASVGDVLTWDGTVWAPAAPSGGGGGLTFNEAASLAAFAGDFA